MVSQKGMRKGERGVRSNEENRVDGRMGGGKRYDELQDFKIKKGEKGFARRKVASVKKA